MTRPFRLTAALTAAVAVAVLAGCTAQPRAVPAAGATAAPAAVQRFACPTRAEVAGLTAIPFTASTSDAASCTYTAKDLATVTVRHPAGSATATLAALRYAAIGSGAETADARGIAFDAFSSTTKRDCTVWFPASDGVASSVTARRTGVAGTKACGLATAVATLAGSATSKAAAPTVAVLSPTVLLGTTTSGERWPWRIGRDAGVRIDRLTGTGYLRPTAASSFTTVAARIPTDATAVVFVSGSEETGASDLSVLRGATRALSAAATRAPKAELIVVGPVADGTVPAEQVDALRTNLRSAAKIAGARYVDPATLGSGATTSAALAGVADGVGAALREAGIGTD